MSAVAAPADLRVASLAALELRDVCKDYGGLRAVSAISTVARPGEVLGIAGPNGAGKTTLFDVISGLTPATSGEVLLGDVPISGATVHKRAQAGLARTFQQPTVASTLTAYENVFVASRFGRAREHWEGRERDPVADAEWVLEWTGLAAAADIQAELLGVFDRKRLMIATAVAMGPRVLLLDEPFGGLNPQEIERTLALIRGVAEFGVTVVVHRARDAGARPARRPRARDAPRRAAVRGRPAGDAARPARDRRSTSARRRRGVASSDRDARGPRPRARATARPTVVRDVDVDGRPTARRSSSSARTATARPRCCARSAACCPATGTVALDGGVARRRARRGARPTAA